MKKEDCICRSGGAKGYDTKWGSQCELYGIKVIDFSFKGHKTESKNVKILSEEELKKGDAHCEKANETLKRFFPKFKPWVANLLRRNWYQVKDSEAIYAIANIDFVNNLVQGGTGWAVQMGIDNQKPVYVFDHNNKKRWFEFCYRTNKFIVCSEEVPPLYEKFAGVGSRETSVSGVGAIEDFFQKHFGKDKESKEELKMNLPLN